MCCLFVLKKKKQEPAGMAWRGVAYRTCRDSGTGARHATQAQLRRGVGP
jgi:hypothetical protein